jgi:ATP/maltotriose-dependent transcriptional regulator MalT
MRGKTILIMDMNMALFAIEAALALGDLNQAASLVESLEQEITDSGARLYLPELCLLGARLADLQGKGTEALTWLERGAGEAHTIELV